MILKELISELDYTLYNGNENVEITELVCDSRKIVKGCLFVVQERYRIRNGGVFIEETKKKRNRDCSSRSACIVFACGNRRNHK